MLDHEIDRTVLQLVKDASTEAEATMLILLLVQKFMREYGETRAEAEKTVRTNIGYLGGYCSDEVRARIERLFKVEHPFFGSIEKNGPPTPEQAFAIGYAMGQKLGRKDD